MGSSGWDDESGERGRPPRERRGEDDRPPGRAYERGGSANASSYDQPSRGSSRGWDDGGSGGRPRARDDWNRSASSRGDGRRGSGDLDDRRPVDPSRASAQQHRYVPGGRDEFDDRSMRGQRPPPRGGNPAGSSGQRRAPGHGGLWDDEPGMSARRRPDAGDPRRRGARPSMNDPRALRRGLISDEEPEEESSDFSFGKAVLVWLLLFLVGAGGAYGYYKVSTPKVHGTPPATISTPSGTASPSASPSASPHARAPSTPGMAIFLA